MSDGFWNFKVDITKLNRLLKKQNLDFVNQKQAKKFKA